MTEQRIRFEKISALAVNPGALEGEAIAALQRARELVKRNPELAHPPSPPPSAVKKLETKPEATFKATITKAHPDWLLILVNLMSKCGHELGVKYRISFDFAQTPIAVTMICEGSKEACETFERNVVWCVNYINKQLR
jgi:hypothetical protein